MIELDQLKNTYATAISSMLPIHRLALLIIATIGSVAKDPLLYDSVTQSILTIPIVDLISINSNFIKDMKIKDIVFATLTTTISSPISHHIGNVIFKKIAKITNYEATIATEKSKIKASTTPIEIKIKLETIEELSRNPRKKLQAINSCAEFILGLAITLAYLSYYGNYLDIALSASILILSIYMHLYCCHYFFTNYLHLEIARTSLTKTAPTTPML